MGEEQSRERLKTIRGRATMDRLETIELLP